MEQLVLKAAMFVFFFFTIIKSGRDQLNTLSVERMRLPVATCMAWQIMYSPLHKYSKT